MRWPWRISQHALFSVPATLSEGALWKHAYTSFVLKIAKCLPASWAPYQLCIHVQAICWGFLACHYMNVMFLYVLHVSYKCRFMLPPLVMTICVTVLPSQAPNLALCTQGPFTCKVCKWGKYNYAEVCATSKNPISPSRNVMLILIGTYYVHTDMFQMDY